VADLEKTIHQLILKQFDIVGLKDPDIEKIYGEGNDEALTISFSQHQEWKEYCINVFESWISSSVGRESILGNKYSLRIKSRR